MKYYIIAGEASGDLHGSNLIRELQKVDKELTVRGFGGEKMREAGAYVVKNYNELNYIGFLEVFINLPKIFSQIRLCKNDILSFCPNVIIFIDFPGFNIRIARWAKKHNFLNIYYISPQIWAWKSSRIKTIKKVVDKMITILPFEKEFYKKNNYEVEYFGHPLMDIISENKNRLPSSSERRIILLPGSRKQEIKYMLPVMSSMPDYFPEYEFIIAGVKSIDSEIYQKYSVRTIKVEYDNLYSLLSSSEAAVVTSGTATLEAALNNVPIVVCYKGSYISYLIARILVKVKYISLVNLIMEKTVVSELIQSRYNIKHLKSELEKLLYSENHRNYIFAEYSELKNRLKQNDNVAQKTASFIYNTLCESM